MDSVDEEAEPNTPTERLTDHLILKTRPRIWVPYGMDFSLQKLRRFWIDVESEARVMKIPYQRRTSSSEPMWFQD